MTDLVFPYHTSDSTLSVYKDNEIFERNACHDNTELFCMYLYFLWSVCDTLCNKMKLMYPMFSLILRLVDISSQDCEQFYFKYGHFLV